MSNDKRLTYEWMIKQIDALEKEIIKQCAFCTGNGVKLQPLEFNKHLNVKTHLKNKNLRVRIIDIRRLEEFINHYEFLILEKILQNKKSGKSVAKWQNLKNRIVESRKIIDKESDSIQYRLDFHTHHSIDTLSKISFIFLPLSFIVGYFGMNFTTMGMTGHNMNKSGILMWKHGHSFIKILLLASLVSSVGYLFYLEQMDSSGKALKRSINRLTKIQATAGDS
tara:strand:+ start:1389 stop:2057 length:669 start_codon:yes stop_codon:yes gene_type:complete